jgi:hypothetical protein
MVTLTFIEVKYWSLAKGTKKSTWLKKTYDVIEMFEYHWTHNMSNFTIAKNPILHVCTKHVKVHYHYVHEEIKHR